jgi:metallo-beta-lactamase class B
MIFIMGRRVWTKSRRRILLWCLGIASLVIASFYAAISFRPIVLAQTIRVVGFTNAPAESVRIADNLYYVGARDVASFLLVGDRGHILIDAGYPETVPQIIANVRKLGFNPDDIALVLNTHAHDDHAGGIAEIQRLTGARLVAGAGDVAQLAAGGRGDYYFGDTMRFEPVAVDKAVRDGELVQLGSLSMRAIATPGHTRGCTSWSFRVAVEGIPKQALLICSVSRLGAPLVDNRIYPEIALDFAQSLARLRAMPCEVFLTPHALQFGLREKRAAVESGNRAAFVDVTGCREFLANNQAAFAKELAVEAAP